MTLFDSSDPRQPEARTAAEDPEPILVPAEAASETLGVVHARFGYDASRTMWADLRDLANVVFLNSTDMERIAGVFEECAGRLTWVDAAVVAHCEFEEAEPLCFDDGIVETWRTRAEST